MTLKILKKTKKYVTVRIPINIWKGTELYIKDREVSLEKQIKEQKIWLEFLKKHTAVDWQDEYSSWHTTYKCNKTNRTVNWEDYYHTALQNDN